MFFKKSNPLILKPNAYRTIFNINASNHKTFSYRSYSQIKGKRESGRAAHAQALIMTKPERVPHPNGISEFRWGYHAHPDGLGGIFYKEQNSLLGKNNESVIGLTIYEQTSIAENRGARRKNQGPAFMSIWANQTNDNLTVNGIKFHKTEKDVEVKPTSPNTERALLLLHECYNQIDTEQGMQTQENLEWAESIQDPIAEFDDKFPDLRF